MIDHVVYFYLFICAALLTFNIFYIFSSKRGDKLQERRQLQWERDLQKEFQRAPGANGGGDRAHQALLERKLRKTEELMAFNEVLSRWREGRQREFEDYFLNYRVSFRDLAVEYGKRPAMERAFFAYVIASYYPPLTARWDSLLDILLGYLDNSTVYCRENVLCALYALGSAQAVERAFEVLNRQGWYHHPRLLSDGMARFTGDRSALVWRLWRNRRRWADFLTVAVVQLATGLDGSFAAAFLEELGEEEVPLETRFALIRYFGRHRCGEAKPLLLDLLAGSGGQESGLAIAAASALARYPGEDTIHSLKEALHSRNWYVRHNAAGSLAALGITREEWEELQASGDRYAVEMLEYIAGRPAPVPEAAPATEAAPVPESAQAARERVVAPV